MVIKGKVEQVEELATRLFSLQSFFKERGIDRLLKLVKETKDQLAELVGEGTCFLDNKLVLKVKRIPARERIKVSVSKRVGPIKITENNIRRIVYE